MSVLLRLRAAGVWLALPLAVFAGGCTGSSGDGNSLAGTDVEVLALWSGAEQERFQAVLGAFERTTGARVTYTSVGRGVANALSARLAEGRPPDVAFLAQPGLLRRLASEGALVPLDQPVVADVGRNYPAVWRDLGSVEGRLYGVPFKAANKSLIWYDVAAFEKAGVVPPETVDGLVDLRDRLLTSGVPPFSLGAADGWTLTDVFENLYLRTAGPQNYDRLARHEIPWTHDSVKAALRLYLDILDPSAIRGGVQSALATRFEASVEQAFTRHATAAMVVEGDFVASVITTRTRAELGVDVDVFAFPRVGGSGPAVMGGGDMAVQLSRNPAATALMRFLASPEAAAPWAAAGGFISPNPNLDLAVYPDDISRALARAVVDAGDDFRFDLSDLSPSAFGASEGQGMRKRLQDLLSGRDVEATAALLEQDAASAFR